MDKPASIFQDPQRETEFMAAYAAVLSLWPLPPEPLDVETRFGITHVNACGDKGNPPLMLLPGFGANSTMWFPNIVALSSRFRVYGVDTNGQPGRSLPREQLSAANSADWMAELLDGLGLEKAYLVGVSLGGWLALHFAIQRPERVARIVLIDPAASFEKMSATFLRHSFWPIMVHPTRAGLVRYFRWMTGGYRVNEKWGEQMVLGILNTRPQPPIRAVAFSDQELSRVRAPTLLLIGERSVIYDPQRVYLRATRLIPDVQAEIIPDASHALNAQNAEIVNARMLEFLQG